MGNSLVKNMRDKFGIERNSLKPQLLTLPLESVRTKDFAKEYEDQQREILETQVFNDQAELRGMYERLDSVLKSSQEGKVIE